MKKTYLIISVLLAIGVFSMFAFGGEKVSGIQATYYKSTSCGCCGIHSQYIDSKGFDIKINNVQNMPAVKTDFGVPYELQSCHTAVIEGYFVEGHIPFEAIDKLLLEKPDIKGIAMPGMPSGSPGMPGTKTEDFVISAVNHDGSYYEFMRI